MQYTVQTLNAYGVWCTDMTTTRLERAQERGKFLIPRAPAVQVLDQTGRRVFLDDRR